MMPLQVVKSWPQTSGTLTGSYLPVSFAHRKIAKGRLNQNIHKTFSSPSQIAGSGLSSNKLILTILFPSLGLVFFKGHRIGPSAVHFNWRDCQIRTKWREKNCGFRVPGFKPVPGQGAIQANGGAPLCIQNPVGAVLNAPFLSC
jgi:hypothetical protein